jgi:hypothetical protein
MKFKNKLRLIKTTLLLTSGGLLALTNTAFGQLALPTSIHDILTATQIEDLKAMQEVKDIKIAKKNEVLTETSKSIYWNPAGLTVPQAFLKSKVSVVVGSQGIGNLLPPLMDEHKISFSDPTNPNGLAVRFAPTDEELLK